MAIGVPMGLVMMTGLMVVLALFFGVRRNQPLPERPVVPARPWSAGERSVLVAFAIAIIGWLAPSMFALIAPHASATHWIDKHLTEEVVALIAGCSLFLLPGGTPIQPHRRRCCGARRRGSSGA